MNKKTPKEIVEQQNKSEYEIDEISYEIANSMPREVGSTRKLTDGKLIDIREIFARGILHDYPRRECMAMVVQFLKDNEIVVGEDVSERQIVSLYTETKKALNERSIGTIEQERQRFLNAMFKVSNRCLSDRDHANFIKAQKEIAEVTGVYDAKDDSKIVINFSPAVKKENG